MISGNSNEFFCDAYLGLTQTQLKSEPKQMFQGVYSNEETPCLDNSYVSVLVILKAYFLSFVLKVSLCSLNRLPLTSR